MTTASKKNPDHNEKDEFIAMLAHELRNPLATILSSAELIEAQGFDAPNSMTLLHTIQERVRTTSNILATLLESSHIPANNSESIQCKKKILVVDDNVTAATSLGRLLELRGHDVAVAHSGPEALTMAREFVPDAVILDIKMPEMDGYEVARQLRAESGSAYALVALTGFGQSEDKEMARQAGFDSHLTKPVALKELEAVLHELLASK